MLLHIQFFAIVFQFFYQQVLTTTLIDEQLRLLTIYAVKNRAKSTVVFRCPIFCRQCFQIDLDLILPYSFISVILNKKAYF